MMRPPSHPFRTAAALAVSLVAVAPAARATVYEIGPADDLRAAVGALLPGDELVLQGGTYSLTFRFSIGVSGTAAAPIVIRAKDGEVPHLTRDPSQNVINVERASYLTLRGLEVTGGSHGIRLLDANYVTVEDCHVHGVGDVAISANIPGYTYRGLRFLRNHIHDTGGTGEGFYLGCNDDGCRIHESLIEGNHIHDTIAGTSQGDGIEIKLGSHSNVVRDNIIHDTRYPCILVYGTQGNPVNVIERNRMWNCGDHGIQAASDAVIVNNVILGAAADGIRSQIHQAAVPGNLVIAHNTVLNAGNALRINDLTGPVLVANNALYSSAGSAIRAGGDLTQLTSAGNVGTGSLIGVSGGFDSAGDRLLDFADAATGDVHLVVGSRLIAAGDPAYVPLDDYDRVLRGGVPDVGAYAFATGCDPGRLGLASLLRAVKAGGSSVRFTWVAAAGASQHHLNRLTDKSDLLGLGPHRRDLSGGLADPACEAAAPAGSCDDPLALSGGPRLFYQVLGACGVDGADEGPWE